MYVGVEPVLLVGSPNDEAGLVVTGAAGWRDVARMLIFKRHSGLACLDGR